LKKKKRFSQTTAYYRKNLKYTAKENIGIDSGSGTRPGYKSTHSMSRRREEKEMKKNAVGFIGICQKFRIRVELSEVTKFDASKDFAMHIAKEYSVAIILFQQNCSNQ